MEKLLHFTADWCGPCQKMKPLIKDFIIANPDIEYQQVDVDNPDNSNLVKENSIMSIPSFVAIKNNQEPITHIGVATIQQLQYLFNK
jgi:thioredoxin 1